MISFTAFYQHLNLNDLKGYLQKIFSSQRRNTKNTDYGDQIKHLKGCDNTYLARDADMAAARNNKNILPFYAILQIPKGAAGPFFYVRKQVVYNLIVNRFEDQDGDCCEFKRGRIEIVTCAYTYISEKQGNTRVRIMFEHCKGLPNNITYPVYRHTGERTIRQHMLCIIYFMKLAIAVCMV